MSTFLRTGCVLQLDYLYHLLDIHAYLENGAEANCDPLKVLDIGTGASAIYAILLARITKEAQIWATELNASSLETASKTLQENDLVPQVHLVRVPNGEAPLLDVISAIDLESGDAPFTFSLCNPPFYASAEDMQASTELKAFPTHAAPTAADNELITRGGEVAFIGRMIDESAKTREKCIWYTSLIGKASSIPLLIGKLGEHQIDNYILLGMRQAHTTRWVLGWSLTDIRLPDDRLPICGQVPTASKHLDVPSTREGSETTLF
ncbi:hypothetical protein QFC20_004576 [Naganishia adeliensis]|uniref:Uncharacterized protein n=1 Tax=Naganishia adeliensis TaxID=92952 RepID=A0ACC2VZ85_9TREE|nr:hypothetical protein QFC20_004576 [Naganishia adeliensis]